MTSLRGPTPSGGSGCVPSRGVACSFCPSTIPPADGGPRSCWCLFPDHHLSNSGDARGVEALVLPRGCKTPRLAVGAGGACDAAPGSGSVGALYRVHVPPPVPAPCVFRGWRSTSACPSLRPIRFRAIVRVSRPRVVPPTWTRFLSYRVEPFGVRHQSRPSSPASAPRPATCQPRPGCRTRSKQRVNAVMRSDSSR